MATRSTPVREGARKRAVPTPDTPSSAEPATAGEDNAAPTASASLEAALEDWTVRTGREQLAWEIAAWRALFRNARAVRETQLQAAERAETTHMQAAEQLLQARDAGQVAEVQFELMRTTFEDALQYWTRVGEAASQGLLQAMQESADGWARVSANAWNGWLEWSRSQTLAASRGDIAEAEVEHLSNPLAASPWFMPMQEATRQMMDAARAGWRDWQDWSQRLPGAVGAAR